MVFSSSLRRVASSAAPLFARSLGRTLLRQTSDGRLLQRAIGSRTDLGFSFPQRSQFSSLALKAASDSELVKVVESEIQCAEECDDHDRVEEIPEGFPFEIQDEKGTNIITLKRKFKDENIEVTVSMSSLVTGEEPDGDVANNNKNDDDEGEAGESSSQSSLPLTVNISRGHGPSLEFICTAYPDEITIDAMSVRENASEKEQEMLAYEGPDFNDLDENLQKAFHKYLELRGITPITTNFLHEYMINKDSREYLHWLNNLKEFVEK
ncbi:uncharacterized protein A4U43_C02F890 [Asparagus officinalis]|uniref:Mitochondrial glycoprotein family protein n=1 Tax=Asparagus officinalis TaxID=4686 RepID=A0A5P1FEV0_ASPOF|nr:uncharacterized protein At2g39795, mitochondrial-like [Asparagus officinalis]ONK76888.1 uncharacterized protein A4U43_C02F890 [Asparagus officinalis]